MPLFNEYLFDETTYEYPITIETISAIIHTYYDSPLLGENLYGETLYGYPVLAQSALYTIPINYTIGNGIEITATWSANIPADASVIIQISFDGGITFTPFAGSGSMIYGVFDIQASGIQDLVLQIFMQTSDLNNLPSIQSLSLAITQQTATLYTIAFDVLTAFGLSALTDFWIDPAFAQYSVPYGYLNNVSYREYIRQIVEAVGGQCYVDRNGVIRLEGPNFLQQQRTTPDQVLTQSDYYDKSNPANYTALANYIIVNTQPLLPADSQQVYQSDSPVAIAIGQSMTIQCNYNQPPVINSSGALSGQPSGCVITNAVYYAWGAMITVGGATVAGSFTITITGQPLTVQDSQQVIAQDATSIQQNGQLTYTLEDNAFVQTPAMGQLLANDILALSKDPRRDLDMHWQGNPALELGDRLTVPNSQISSADFWITQQTLDFDGGLDTETIGKEVIEE